MQKLEGWPQVDGNRRQNMFKHNSLLSYICFGVTALLNEYNYSIYIYTYIVLRSHGSLASDVFPIRRHPNTIVFTQVRRLNPKLFNDRRYGSGTGATRCPLPSSTAKGAAHSGRSDARFAVRSGT